MLVWLFIKNTGYFLLGLTLVPLAWFLLSTASMAIMGSVRPGWEYEWLRFSSNSKLLMGTGVDLAYAFAAVRVFWPERKFAAFGVLCSVAADFAVRALSA